MATFNWLRQLVQHIRAWRHRRDDARWERVESFRREAMQDGWKIGQVTCIRQKAKRGAKAQLRWIDTGEVSAAWFEGWWPPHGAVLVVAGRAGYGPHHGEEVFYVSQTVHSISGSSYRAWCRVELRRRQALIA